MNLNHLMFATDKQRIEPGLTKQLLIDYIGNEVSEAGSEKGVVGNTLSCHRQAPGGRFIRRTE